MILLGICGVGEIAPVHAQNHLNCTLVGHPGSQYYMLPMGFGSRSHTMYVKVYFRVFQEGNGSEGLSLVQIEAVKANLNAAFNPHGIYFIYDCQVDFIPNTFLCENGLKSQAAI